MSLPVATSRPNRLVIVCGHGIWLGGPQKGWDESEWLIESYKAGETPTFIEHIKAGVKAIGEDDRAVLAFSGGRTWKETQLSEASSYSKLAATNSYFGLLSDITEDVASRRILVEEQALDSYYNILFSLVLFWRTHRVWPERLAIVSHAFKRSRLVDGHCAAIGFPLDRITFIGISPPGIDDSGSLATPDQASQLKADAMIGVGKTVDDWTKDPHGVGEVLAGKRRARNPWRTEQKLFQTDDEREKSGVQTRFLEDGTETLVEGGTGPWAVTS